jgi:hypothetical protein
MAPQNFMKHIIHVPIEILTYVWRGERTKI